MWELPNDRSDFARKQGAAAGHTEKAGCISYPELPIEQAGFRRGRGTRDHIANLRRMNETAREHQRYLCMCFIDYKKAFDCVDHEILWVILREEYGSASTPDSVTEKDVHQPGSDSQDGVWRDRQYRH